MYCLECGIAMSVEYNGALLYSKAEGRINYIVIADVYKCPLCSYRVASNCGRLIYDGEWTQDELYDYLSKTKRFKFQINDSI